MGTSIFGPWILWIEKHHCFIVESGLSPTLDDGQRLYHAVKWSGQSPHVAR